MNNYERVMAAIDKMSVPDRIPVIPLTRVFAIKYSNYKFIEVINDLYKYVDSQHKCFDDFGYDAVWSNSIDIVAKAFGCEVKLFEDDNPDFISHPVSCREDLNNIKIDLNKSGWLDYSLEIINKLQESYKYQVPIITTVNTPVQTAYSILGNMFYLGMISDPSLIQEVIKLCTKPAIEVAQQSINAGADLIFCPNAVGSRNMISREHYLQFISPINKIFFTEIKNSGAQIIYHTCGDFSDRFDIISEEGADIIHLANPTQIEPEQIYSYIAGKSVIMGLVPPVSVMLNGNAADVKNACNKDIDSYCRNNDFILSADCLLPKDIPAKNLRIMIETCRHYG